MSSRGELIKQRAALRAKLAQREPVRPIFRALTGDGTGGDPRIHVRVEDEPTRMYVRVEGRGVLEAAVAVNVPMRHDVPVYVGPTQENPDVYEILGINFGEVTSPGGFSYVPSHHWSHEFGSGSGADDVVWISKEQFLPFLAAPTDPPSTDLYAYPGFYLYLTDWQYYPGGFTGDLTVHNPAAGLAVYVLISINAVTNVLAVTAGVAFAPFPPSNPALRIPQCPAGHFPLMAVYLLNTTTEITWDNLYDVRLMMGGGVNTTVPGPHHLIDTVVHDDTIAHHPPVEGDMILANGDTPPAWDVLAHPGGDWRFIRSTATTAQWSVFDWDNVASQLGADVVHNHQGNAEGGNILHLIDDYSNLHNHVAHLGAPNLTYHSYLCVENIWNPFIPTQVHGVSDGGGISSGRVCFIGGNELAGSVFWPVDLINNSGVGDRRIRLAGGANHRLSRHPVLLVLNHHDNYWYEIDWTGTAGGLGAHNILSATHGDSRAAAVERGAIITGQVNHPFALLEWTRLDYPGTRHHLQTDDLDVVWDEDVMMATTHWIGLGDASGYGTGEGRIAFYDMGLGRDVIANLDADVGVGTEHPNIAGEAVALTIESPTGTPTLELSRLDDVLPADAMIGVIRWFSGDATQCAQAQIDVVQTGYYEGESVMEFWVADDCALCHVMDLTCEDGMILYGGESEIRLNPEVTAWQMAVSTFLALPGLRAFWPMSSVDYAVASRARDLSGGGYHLTSNNTPTFDHDDLAPFVEFDGVNQYLSRADGGAANWADITGTETYINAAIRGLTLGGWFYFDNDPGANTETIMSKRGAGGVATWSYTINRKTLALGGELRFIISDGIATDFVDSGASVSGGVWRLMIARYTPSVAIDLFVNDATTQNAVGIPAALVDSAVPFTIGARSDPTNYMDGRASMCFLCAAALSDQLIGQLFYQTRGLFKV